MCSVKLMVIFALCALQISTAEFVGLRSNILCFSFIFKSKSYYKTHFPISASFPPVGPRIVGGVNATEGQAPFQCSLQRSKNHFCGCAVLNEEWILTAGHCVSGYDCQLFELEYWKIINFFCTVQDQARSKFWSVQLIWKLAASYTTQKTFSFTKITSSQVTQTTSHWFASRETFHSRKMFNQFHCIHTKSKKIRHCNWVSWYFHRNFKRRSTKTLFVFHFLCKTAGWGRLSAHGGIPNILQVINLNSVTYETCRESVVGKHVHIGHLCTLNKAGEGACNVSNSFLCFFFHSFRFCQHYIDANLIFV